MRKKLLLGLFLIMAGISTSTSQSKIDLVDGTVFMVEGGATVTFDLEAAGYLVGIGTYNLELTSSPNFVTKSDFERSVGVISVLGAPLIEGSFAPVYPYWWGDYRYDLVYYPLLGGRSVVSSFTMRVVESLGLKNVENTAEFSVFSKNGIVTVNNANDSAVTGMAVYSISGSKVFESNKAVETIDLSAVANGIYVLTVQEGASVTTKKFLKS